MRLSRTSETKPPWCEGLTSMEQPIMEPRSRAFFMMENRFLGAFLVSYSSPTPPVKSSMASRVLPPFRDS